MAKTSRPPPVCPPSAANLSVKLLSAADVKRCVPVNALILVDDDTIFLAVAGALRDLRKGLLSKTLGYIFCGKTNKKTLFILNVGRNQQGASGVLAALQPRVVIWLGFCRSSAQYHCLGDVIIADKVLCKAEGKQDLFNRLKCSDFLAGVFHDGRFGWSGPCARRQFVHREGVMQPAPETDANEALQLQDDYKAVAVAPPTSTDFLRMFSQAEQEWIALYGNVGDRNEARWTPYVAMMLSSFLCKVLLDDGIFSALEDDREGAPADLLPTCAGYRLPIEETAVALHRDYVPLLPSPVGDDQKRAASRLSRAPSSSVAENQQLHKKDYSTLDVREKSPVEHTCHNNLLPTLAAVYKKASGVDDSYMPRPPDGTRSTQSHRHFRSFRLSVTHGAESTGTAVHAKWARLLISRVRHQKPASIHCGLACAVETVLPPVVTSLY